MNELTIFDRDGVEVVDSRDVAEAIGKNHKELLRDIRNYAETLEKSTQRNFALSDFFIPSTYTDSTGRTLPCYLLTKKGCDMVANKMTGEKGVLFTAMYVTAFEKMRERITKPMSTPEMLLAQAQLMVEQERRLSNVESAMELLVAPPTVDWQRDMNQRMTSLCTKYSLNYEQTRSKLYDEIERVGCWNLDTRVTNARKRAEQQGSTKAQLNKITKLSVIAAEPAMKAVYETQFQKLCSRCSYESGKVGC